ncbi:MAG: hypothetical protein GXO20_00385 [Thermodesulfobacteria bacterium]|nr:hypothetical protein [Thermodesulfobacteriota bacterium]
MSGLSLYFQVLGLTLLLCGALVLVLWGVRRLRFGRAPSSEAIKLVAFRPLSAKSQLLLVEVEGQKLLLGLGEGGPRLICRLGKGDAVKD